MNVICKALILLTLTLTAVIAQAKSFNQCLAETQNLHRIEREENIISCFKNYKSTLGSDNCYAQIRKLKAAEKSLNLSEKLKNICFYEASIFQNIKNCTARAHEFKNADGHDEAIFQCYRDFQEKLSKKDCLETSKKLIYPAKQDHLRQHCIDNYN